MLRLACVAASILTMHTARADVVFVDVDAQGANSGRNWTDAYVNLQDALRRTRAADEIWVAEGVYYPTTGGDRSKSFTLKDGVSLYGGFAGIEENRNERDWETHLTVLSGDIGEREVLSDNTYRVVVAITVGESTVLNGFTITRANNDRPEEPGRGGGMYNENSSLVIHNCRFVDNTGGGGGGMWNESSSPMILNCSFVSNRQRGLLNNNGSDPQLVDCIFKENWTFADGAGMGSFDGSHPRLFGCRFVRNKAKRDGGGYYGFGNPLFENCEFIRNKAGNNAGAAMLRRGSATFTNCIIYGNRANLVVGGISTFGGQNAPTITNCIFWANRDPRLPLERQQLGLDAGTINYSCVEGWTGKYGGVGNHGEDPLFLDAKKDNYRLRAGSPSIDKGDNEAVTEAKDLDGNPRILHETVDMGAYESPCHEVRGFKLSCNDKGKLKATAKTRLPQGSTVTLTNSNGKPKPVTINEKGKAKTKWKNQAGPTEICPAGCDGPCKEVQCP